MNVFRDDNQVVVYTENELQRGVTLVADQIARFLRCYHIQSIDVFPVMNGAMYFAPDLMRKVKEFWPAVEMYVVRDIVPERRKRITLVVDTIYDTGVTANSIRRRFREIRGANDFYAFLLRKERKPDFAHWISDLILPEEYVYGYGLDDHSGCRRELPFIAYDRLIEEGHDEGDH